MSANNKTRSALRAALKQEDAALTERIPDAETAATAAASEEKPTSDSVPPVAADAASSQTTAPVEKAAAPKRTARAPAKAAKAPAKAGSVKAPTKATASKATVAEVQNDKPAPAPVKKPARKAAAAAAPEAAATAPAKKTEAKRDAEDADRGKKQKTEKVVRDSFSMPATEHASIKSLRIALGKAGRLASKSEVLRAGLKLLSERSATDVIAMLDTLPVAEKGKRKKH